MTYYCEKCQSVCEQEVCSRCGNKKLRAVENKDFCFLTEVDSMFGEMFGNILKEENIAYVAVPSGSGLRSCFALGLENHTIYVPFECLSKVRELLNEILKDFADEQKNNLIENIDKLHAIIRGEKKIKKKLKLTAEDSLVDYCKEKIMHADKIVDEGKISGCSKGGSYLFVYVDDDVFIINSVTYEIISANKVK